MMEIRTARDIDHWGVYKRREYNVVAGFDANGQVVPGYEIGPFMARRITADGCIDLTQAAIYAAQHLNDSGFLPMFHFRLKRNTANWRELRSFAIEIKAIATALTLFMYHIDCLKIDIWTSTAQVGDHYDGGDFTIDVEEYAIPGWEVHKREDEQDEKPKDIAL